MKLLTTTAFLLVTTVCFAQRQNVYYFKNNGTNVMQRDSADYIRVVSEPDSGTVLYNVFEFYPNGKTKRQGKSSVINPVKFEGGCVSYYQNGKKQSVINYSKGDPVGPAFEFYPNGKPYEVKQYPDVVNADYKDADCLITAEYDSLGTPMVTDGNGYYKGFDNKFKNIVEEGNLKNGKNDGQWKGDNEGSHIRYFETYDNGKFISGLSIGENGDTVHYKVRGIEPQYKGGQNAFARYLGNSIHYPDFEKEHNTQGKVMVSFVVEKDGKITNVKITKSVSLNIDKEAYRVVSESPKWMPGVQYGRPVRVQFTIPLNFALADGN